MNKKQVLLCVPHMPAFDSSVPLMIRLHERGIVHPRVILGPRLRKVEPRAEEVLKSSGIDYKNVSVLGLELFSLTDIWRSDCIITHSDPVAFSGKFRPRDSFTTRLKKPMVFLQHGMVQQGLHTAGIIKPVWDYYAERLIVWNELPEPDAPWLAKTIKDRLRVTGITKQNLLGDWEDLGTLKAQFSQYDRRILICHNFGFEPVRYSDEMFEKALNDWRAAALARPNYAFILRSHRGKRHSDIEEKISQLCAECPNVIRSERHQGLTRMATIHDVMSLVDCVVSHPSTVILDAVYDDKPVAVLNPFQSAFEALLNVDEIDQFMSFIDAPDATDTGLALRKIYGDVTTNLDKAAEVVEELVQH